MTNPISRLAYPCTTRRFFPRLLVRLAAGMAMATVFGAVTVVRWTARRCK